MFAKSDTGAVVFQPAPPVTDLDVTEVLATIEPGIVHLLERRGRGDDAEMEDPLAEESPMLAGLAAASVQGRVALGPTRGARVSRRGDPGDAGETERLTVTADGQVLLRFRQPWRDGTTHLVFDPVEFLGRLAVLVSRPRINLIRFTACWRPARRGERRSCQAGRRRIARRTRRWPTPRPLTQRRRRGAGPGVRRGPR